MKLSHALSVAAFFAAGIFSVTAQPSNAVATAPVYVPDYTHSTEPMPDGVFAWDAVTKAVDATNGQDFARFTFSFTNLATVHETVFRTNFTTTTNITATTNVELLFFKKIFYQTNIATVPLLSADPNGIRGIPVAVLSVHPSCGCTTAELPPVPWIIPPGSNGTIKLSVNLAGKSGTLFKTVNITTEKGKKDLLLRINVAPPPPMPEMTEAQRAAGIAAAKIDRQAIFKGDCASCHLPKVEGKYGQQLFDALCAICHQAKSRATMVPDLANLQVPTSEEFWRAWITSGKAGSLMPAFAAFQGGPLNDLQIASLATYLNAIHPSKVAPATNAPAAK